LDRDFSQFVRRRGKQHLRTAVLLTGDWHSAEDLVQSCLLKPYRAWPRLDTGADPDAYLRKILVNTHRSWWRVSWRQEVPIPSTPDVAEAQDDQALTAAVRAALKRLPAARSAPSSSPSHCCCPRWAAPAASSWGRG
jgi:DNA-directed RNA polymerase specialized sigma24 family protein